MSGTSLRKGIKPKHPARHPDLDSPAHHGIREERFCFWGSLGVDPNFEVRFEPPAPSASEGDPCDDLRRHVQVPVTSQKLVTLLARPKNEDLATLRDLMAAGKLAPVIGQRYSLSEVPAAIRYLEAGHTRGKVVIVLE
jgi:hypothetical protein